MRRRRGEWVRGLRVALGTAPAAGNPGARTGIDHPGALLALPEDPDAASANRTGESLAAAALVRARDPLYIFAPLMDIQGRAMGLFIRDDAVRELAARLAERRRCTLTDAVREALEEKLSRLDAEYEEKIRKTREIQARVAALPELRPGFTDADMYDEDGNPVL
jgi:hypothetical protein